MIRRTVLGSASALGLVVMMGCSSMTEPSAEQILGYQPEVREIAPAKRQVNDISSRVLDWMGVEGTVSEPAAGVRACDAVDPKLTKYYVVSHPWSIYDLRKGTFEQAMQNLRVQLPKHGWEITKDGPMKSRDKDPQIVAVDRKSHHTLTVEWLSNRAGSLKDMIGVDVDSRCYRAPEGTDIYKEK
ncbi:hypothetical protein BKD26_15080 [Streptomyces sp. CB03238]|nr:hypothetical protein BKD26_15080 [Streptomyces sp. CB03238]